MILFTTDFSPAECGRLYLDSGGSNRSYGNDESIETTISPDNPGDAVTVTFTYVDIESSTGGETQNGC